VLEQNDGEMEREFERPEPSSCFGERGIGGRIVSGHPGAVAMGGGVEERRPEADRKLLDDGQQLVQFRRVTQHRCGFQ
jgi:hypothetical protein